MVSERLVAEPDERVSFESTYGADLDGKISAADALIDSRLGLRISVPLASPPQVVKDVSADYAAAFFRMDRGEVEQAKALIKRAEKTLQAYIVRIGEGVVRLSETPGDRLL